MRTIVLLSLMMTLSGCSSQNDAAKNAVKGRLTDPASAEFRNWFECPTKRGWTGEVNAKTPYGGLGGYVSFDYVDGRLGFASPGNGSIADFDSASSDYADLMPRCLNGDTKLSDQPDLTNAANDAIRELKR